MVVMVVVVVAVLGWKLISITSLQGYVKSPLRFMQPSCSVLELLDGQADSVVLLLQTQKSGVQY